MLRYMIIFSTLLMTAINVQAQCESPAVGENRILTDELDEQTYIEGSTVNFACSAGYVPVNASASRSITCNGSHWSDLELQCKKNSCESPGEILNGKYRYLPKDGLLFGAHIIAECNDGYVLVGQPTRKCTESGWDGTAPVCEAHCKRPVVGENRILFEETNQKTFPNGSTLRFKCSIGYVSERTSLSRSITCNGTHWSDLKLQCKKKSCGNPGEILNGKYRYQPKDGVLFGASITAECNEGFLLLGRPTRNCRENGWDGRNPECEVVKCETPPSIPGGTFNPEEDLYNYGETVTYSCNRGLDLIGPSEITCSSDGNFQPSSPRCQSVACEKPVIPHADRIEGKSPPYRYYHVVRYRCHKGYRMEGFDFLTCKENGWDPHPPNCTAIKCSKPAITNGQFKPSKELYSYAETVTYSCNEGFTHSGPSVVSCADDGTFQTSECLEITCDPPSIPYAVVYGSSPPYKYNVSVQIECSKGYRLEGSRKLTCGKHGWNPSHARCIEVTCEPPIIKKPVIVISKDQSYRYNTSIRYQCEKGYRMEGSDFLTCEENGWNRPPPICNIVTCKKPSVIMNGQFTSLKEVYEYGQTVTYSCNVGFRHQGDSRILCSENGTFHPPRCLALTCPKPPDIKNGQFEPLKEVYEYGQTVTYSCNKGFILSGASTISCTENGPFQTSSQCLSLTHILSPLGGLVGVLAVGGGVYFFFKKKKKPLKSKVNSEPETCTLVNMSPKHTTKEDVSSKSTY